MSLYTLTSAEAFKQNIEKWDDDYHVFYRFQHKDHEVGEKSWGMIFGSEEEAIADAEEWGMTPEEAVLPGKSCTFTFGELSRWMCEFDKDYVVIAFEGWDTYETGHDGEYVARFDEVIAAISYDDYLKIDEELTGE